MVIHHAVAEGNRADIDRIIAAFSKGLGEKITKIKGVPIKEFKDLDDFALEEAMLDMTAKDFNKVRIFLYM